MNDTRTKEQRLVDLLKTVHKCRLAGWNWIEGYNFLSPTTGEVKDLSATNLDLLNIHQSLL